MCGLLCELLGDKIAHAEVEDAFFREGNSPINASRLAELMPTILGADQEVGANVGSSRSLRNWAREGKRSGKMSSNNQWEEFFDSHAPHYMKNSFTKNTLTEVDFLLEVLELAPGAFILDIGCGTGRHAIELAKRGYRVTGVDISSGMLAEAEKAAQDANVIVEWIQSDATQFQAARHFDAAICLCEGAFGLLSTNEDPVEHDKAILRNISTALKPRGPFLLTTFNGIAKLRQLTQEDLEQGRFDPATMIEESDQELDLPEGKKTVHVKERYYTPEELTWLLQQQGLLVEHIWGGTAGKWGRRKINLDEIEVMVVARKTG